MRHANPGQYFVLLFDHKCTLPKCDMKTSISTGRFFIVCTTALSHPPGHPVAVSCKVTASLHMPSIKAQLKYLKYFLLKQEHVKCSRGSVVSILTRLRARRSEIRFPGRGTRFYSSPKRPNRLQGSSSLLVSDCGDKMTGA
jgi:hypothetical protein